VHLLTLLQLATQPGGAYIAPHPVHAPKFEVDMVLHVSDPFTNQPQQRSAVQFIVDLLCQADRLESEFLFVNYNQDLIVGLFESLFKAAMIPEFFDDIVKSNGVQSVMKLLRKRVRRSLHRSLLSLPITCDLLPQLCREVPFGTPSSLSPDEQQRLVAQSAQRCNACNNR
jgi:hypothetical protein